MSRQQIASLPGLLWMKYKPSELAEEIGITTDTIYKSYIKAGCPHERDAEGNIWIIGTDFAVWVRKIFVRKPKHVRTTNMSRDQAWCMKCHRSVDIVGIEISDRDKVEMISGQCCECGSKVNRLRSKWSIEIIGR